jgi:hypothetical protein
MENGIGSSLFRLGLDPNCLPAKLLDLQRAIFDSDALSPAVLTALRREQSLTQIMSKWSSLGQ